MSKKLTTASIETIEGDPTHTSSIEADLEYERLISSGGVQPFLIAVQLRDEPNTLHLRVQIANPAPDMSRADLQSAPPIIRHLADSTSDRNALAWHFFDSRNDASLYFDPQKQFDFWSSSQRVEGQDDLTTTAVVPADVDSDLAAETSAFSNEEVDNFERKIEDEDYSVPDAFATSKTRGSAQRAFARKVKKAYGWKCAVTGITSPQFLVASHIVPWGVDETIRLDPSNGICLSVLIDRAFEYGFLQIEDDLLIRVDWSKVAADSQLEGHLRGYDGVKLRKPVMHAPNVEYLRRKRKL